MLTFYFKYYLYFDHTYIRKGLVATTDCYLQPQCLQFPHTSGIKSTLMFIILYTPSCSAYVAKSQDQKVVPFTELVSSCLTTYFLFYSRNYTDTIPSNSSNFQSIQLPFQQLVIVKCSHGVRFTSSQNIGHSLDPWIYELR